jgi:hypothetical protein
MTWIFMERQRSWTTPKERLQNAASCRRSESISEINSLADEIWTNPDPLPGKGDRDPLKRLCFRGSQVLVGTNRKANRKATFVLASPEDLWFHARNVPGAHVILRTTKKGTLPEDVLEFASSLAAFTAVPPNTCGGLWTIPDGNTLRQSQVPFQR